MSIKSKIRHYLGPEDNGWTLSKYKSAFNQLRKDTLLLTALNEIREENLRWGKSRIFKNPDCIDVLRQFEKDYPNEGLTTEYIAEYKYLVCVYDSRAKTKYNDNIGRISREIMFGLAGFVFSSDDASVMNRCLPRAATTAVRKYGHYREEDDDAAAVR